MDPNAPFRPDFLGLGDFTVAPDSSASNVHRGQMFYEPGYLTEAVTQRELLRAALAPAEEDIPPRSEIDPDILAAVNNLRLAQVMKAELGITADPVAPIDNIRTWYVNAVKAGYHRRALLHRIQLIDTSGWGELRAAMDSALGRFLEQVTRRPLRTWDDVVGTARTVQGWFDQEESARQEKGRDKGGSNGDPRSHQNQSDHGRDNNPIGKPKWFENMNFLQTSVREDSIDDARLKLARSMPKHPENVKTWWGEMYIEYAELVQEHPARSGARKVRPREFGDSLRFIDRDLSDDRVFGSMRPVKGGTILIDNSGSMGLNIEQVWAIVSEAPYAEIAHYDGWTERVPYGYDGTNRGRLKVVSHHGRVAHRADLARAQGANVVDGPALDWLITRKRPFLWVSDGHVTGRGEDTNQQLRAYCDLLCLRGHVRRVDHVEDAVRLLRSGGFR